MRFSVKHGLLASGAALVLCGCALDHSLALQGPTRTLLEAQPTFEDLIVQYRSGIGAMQARNQIIRRLMLADDEYFLAYTDRLYHGRALADTAGEIINASLTTAATAINPAAAAKVLTGIAAGLAASKLSVDKNIFMQQATTALIAKMEAQRAQVDTRIHSYLTQSVEDYPLEEGLRDFLKYYRAGTLAAAAQSLTADAEQQHTAASDELHDAKLQASPLQSFTTPRTHITLRRSPDAGKVRAGADVIPQMPAAFQPRNRRLRDAFEPLNDAQARAALIRGGATLPPKVDAKEFLAQQILADASLDTRHGSSAVASLTYYRRCAVDEGKTAALENAYGKYLFLPPLPQTVTVGSVNLPTPAPIPTPAP